MFHILGRDLVSPLRVIEEGPSRNVIAHYVKEIDCILDILYTELKKRDTSRFSITRDSIGNVNILNFKILNCENNIKDIT